jgi:hypothetical protein
VQFLSTDADNLGRMDWQATPRDRFCLRYLYQSFHGKAHETICSPYCSFVLRIRYGLSTSIGLSSDQGS